MPETHTERSVLLAFDASSRGEAALGTASRLAAALHCRLAAVFVEDDNLRRLLAMPFAQEVLLLSGRTRPLSTAGLERDWERAAARMRIQLEQAAARWRLEWSFRVERDALAFERDARHYTLRVLGRHTSLVRGPLLRPRPQAHTHPVVLIVPAPGVHAGAVSTACLLARIHTAPVLVLITAEDESEFEHCRAAVQDMIEAERLTVRCEWLKGEQTNGHLE